MTAPPGGGVIYHIRHSPVLAIDVITCVGEASTSEAVDTSILLTGLDPRVFYSVMVDAIIQNALPTTGSGKNRIHVHSIQLCIYHTDFRNCRVSVRKIHGCLGVGFVICTCVFLHSCSFI